MEEKFDPPYYWWYWITGPNNVTSKIQAALESNKNVALFVPDDLPWRKPMRLNVKGRQTTKNVEIIDIEEDEIFSEALDDVKIGDALCKRLDDSGYRDDFDVQDYLSKNSKMKKRVFWIKGMKEEQEHAWIGFCKKFKSGGFFILELKHVKSITEENFETIIYDDIVDERDLSLFNAKIIDMIRPNFFPSWKQYAATLCACLCGKDAELSERLLKELSFRSNGPKEIIECLKILAKDKDFERRGVKNEKHIFYDIRRINNNSSRIDKKIWKAQLQVFFPMIEMERINFIEVFRDELRKALEYNKEEDGVDNKRRPYHHREKNINTYIEQRDDYGNYVKVSDPSELELQTIVFMLHLDYKYKPILELPNSVIKKIMDLYALRNLIAHVNVCEIKQYENLLNDFPFDWGKHHSERSNF